MRKHFYPVTVPLKLITLREVNKDRHLLLLFFCNIEVTRGCTTMPDRRGLRAAYQADEWARGPWESQFGALSERSAEGNLKLPRQQRQSRSSTGRPQKPNSAGAA